MTRTTAWWDQQREAGICYVAGGGILFVASLVLILLQFIAIGAYHATLSWFPLAAGGGIVVAAGGLLWTSMAEENAQQSRQADREAERAADEALLNELLYG